MRRITKNLYQVRFTDKEIADKQRIWAILCQTFFQKFVDKNDKVLDLGSGFCEFINNIHCKEKFALDSNKENLKYAEKNVKTFLQSGTDLSNFKTNFFNIVFASNLFEHLNSKLDVEKTIKQVWRILKPHGKFLILQPNIKYTFKEYWDFFDHNLPFSHLAMSEVLIKNHFKIINLIPRFLPYTTKTNLPRSSFLIKLYLKVKFLQKLFGKQMFIIAQK